MNEITTSLIEAVSDACERYPSITPAGGTAQLNTKLWDALDQIGVTLLAVPESAGGAGGDLPMAAALMQVLGKYSATVPFAETAILAAWLLAECKAGIPNGPLAAALATDRLQITEDDGNFVLNGTLPRIAWANEANQLVVLAGRRVIQLQREEFSVTRGRNIAGEPRDDVRVDNVSIPSERMHEVPETSVVCEDSFIARGALAKVALTAGAAQKALDLTIRYSAERKQFGRPVAVFQAVQQQVAGMAGEVLVCQMAAESAAIELENGNDAGLAIAAAKSSSSASAGVISRISHQIHGAIGFTDEHALRLSTTRLWAWRDEFGSEIQWAKKIGRLVNSAGADDLWSTLVD